MSDPEKYAVVLVGDAPSPQPSKPLLPWPVSSLVSCCTRTTTSSLRAVSFVAGIPFNLTRSSVLAAIEVGRIVVQASVAVAGEEVARATREEGRLHVMQAREDMILSVNRGFNNSSLVVAIGFQSFKSSFSYGTSILELSLHLVNSLFGNTEASRVVRSVVMLSWNQLRNPTAGLEGERILPHDYAYALTTLTYLQHVARHLDRREQRKAHVEQVIWDLLIRAGERVDYQYDNLSEINTPSGLRTPAAYEVAPIFFRGLTDTENDTNDESAAEDDELKAYLGRHLYKLLPNDARLSMSTTTTKTITVHIRSRQVPMVPPPPGFEVQYMSATNNPQQQDRNATRDYYIVYRLHREGPKRQRRPAVDEELSKRLIEMDGDSSDDESPMTLHVPARRRGSRGDAPVVPPKDFDMGASKELAGSVAVLVDPTTGTHASRWSKSSDGNQSQPAVPTSRNTLSMADKRGKGKFKLPLPRPFGGKESSLFEPQHGGSRKSVAIAEPDRSSWNSPAKHRSLMQPLIPTRASSSASRQDPGRHYNVLTPPREVHSPEEGEPRSPGGSRTTLHRKSSVASISDSVSMLSIENHPAGTAAAYRHSVAAISPGGGILKSRSEKDMTEHANSPESPHHRRAKSSSSSIYTLRTDDGAARTTQPLAAYGTTSEVTRSGYHDSMALSILRSSGVLDEMFPRSPLVENLDRYMRFSSAAYGAQFLQSFGIASMIPPRPTEDIHFEIQAYAHHTGLEPEDVLVASFIDSQGGSDASGLTDTNMPLVHWISLDHEAKAVVLACRGTLGLDDLLADMVCDYDDLEWRGAKYNVHRGIHASATRLLYGRDGIVLSRLRDELEKHEDYGLVLCGHSLGGAVTALLGVMLSEPQPGRASFVTSAKPFKQPLSVHNNSSAATGTFSRRPEQACLPPGRPIHVFAYGAPGTMSASLREATKGLITTVHNGFDIVPFLSLGTLHDFQAAALAIKQDNPEARRDLRRRIWAATRRGVASIWRDPDRVAAAQLPLPEADEEARWALGVLKGLRSNMHNTKLLPPGEVYSIRLGAPSAAAAAATAGTWGGRPGSAGGGFGSDSAGAGSMGGLGGSPPRQVVFSYVRDVEARFRELRLAAGIKVFTDHNPKSYEDALKSLNYGLGMPA